MSKRCPLPPPPLNISPRMLLTPPALPSGASRCTSRFPAEFGPIFWLSTKAAVPGTSSAGYPLYTAMDATTHADAAQYLASLVNETVRTPPVYGSFDIILDHLTIYRALFEQLDSVHAICVNALLHAHAYRMPIGACDPDVMTNSRLQAARNHGQLRRRRRRCPPGLRSEEERNVQRAVAVRGCVIGCHWVSLGAARPGSCAGACSWCAGIVPC